MRFQIMCRMDGQEDFADLFDTDTIEDARQVAIRAAMRPGFTVFVYDVRLGERVMDFDDPRHAR